MVIASVNYITVLIEGLGRLPEKLSLAFALILKEQNGSGAKKERKKENIAEDNALKAEPNLCMLKML